MKGLCALTGVMLLLLLPGGAQAGIGSELNGLGSFGVSLGAMRWLADEDVAKYNGAVAQVRPIGKAIFRYRMNTNWLLSIETGFGWNSYANSGDVVTSVIPTTFGIERRLGDWWGTTISLAGGAGFYVWARRQNGDFLIDPETSHQLHALDPGVYVGGCSEFHLSDHVTCAVQPALHYILNTRGEDTFTIMGGDDLFVDLRIGVNYYFSPFEGLIWNPDSGGGEQGGGTDEPEEPRGSDEDE